MSSAPILRFVLMTEKAIPPTRGSARAAGLDLHSACYIAVPARGKVLVTTDLQTHVPEGFYGRIAPRSWLALHHYIDVGGGVINGDNRGNEGVILFNHSDEPFVIAHGNRIAQLICEKAHFPVAEEVLAVDTTERGAGGFGSTSKK